MSIRSNVIMLVLVAILGGFWYFHDIKGEESKKEAENREAAIFADISASDILAVTWHDPNNKDQERSFKKEDGLWHIIMSNGFDVLAGSDGMSRIIDMIAGLKHDETVAETPSPEGLAEYGLDKPAYTLDITVKPADERSKDKEASDKAASPEAGQSPQADKANDASKSSNEVLSLAIGSKTPDEQSYYVRTGQGPVWTISDALVSQFNCPLADMRENSLFSYSPTDITKMLFSYKDSALVLVKNQEEGQDDSEAKWALEAPEQAPADSQKVMDFLWSLRGVRVGRFMHEGEKDKLGTVQASFEVYGIGSDKPQRVEIGNPVAGAEGEFYAHRFSPDEYFTVKAEDGEKLAWDKTAADLEDHHLFSFKIDDVQRIEMLIGGLNEDKNSTGEVKKIDARRIRGGWDVAQPALTVKDEQARNNAITALLYAVSDIEWSRRAPEAGNNVPEPESKVVLYGKGTDVIGTLLFGKDTPEGGVYACVDGVDGVYLLPENPNKEWDVQYKKLDAKEAEVSLKDAPEPKKNPEIGEPEVPVKGAAMPPSAKGVPEDPSTKGTPKPPSATGTPKPPEFKGIPKDPTAKGSPLPPTIKGVPSEPKLKGTPLPPTMKGTPKPPEVKGIPTAPSAKGTPKPPTKKGVPKGNPAPGVASEHKAPVSEFQVPPGTKVTTLAPDDDLSE